VHLILPLSYLDEDAETLSALIIAFPTIYILGSAFPPQVVLLLYPRYAPPPPDKDSIRGKALVNDVEDELQKLLVVAKLRGREGWYETRKSDGT
jgi:hypothetical protein